VVVHGALHAGGHGRRRTRGNHGGGLFGWCAWLEEKTAEEPSSAILGIMAGTKSLLAPVCFSLCSNTPVWFILCRVLADTDAVATFPSATAAVQAAYDDGATDQYVPAFVVVDDDGTPVGRMADGDAVLFWNYRGDRAKEMAAALDTPPGGAWPHFDRGDVPALRFAGLLTYDEEQGVPRRSLVGSEPIDQPLGAVVAAAGLRRLCVAETKKYGHLTYFFNGHRAAPFDDATETYVQVDSLPGQEQDHPAMATAAVADVVVAAVRGDDGAVAPVPDLLCVNLANGDMCGHTGVMDAVVAGMETIDAALRRLLVAVVAAGGVAMVTADHGNAEQMAAHGADGRPLAGDAPQGWTPLTAHTAARVPLWVVGAGVGGMAIDGGARWDAGQADHDATCTGAGIGNVSAAVLHLLGLDSPDVYLPSVLVAKGGD